MRGGWWAWAMTASMLLVSQIARAECTKDLDCEAELICEEGRCVASPPPAPPPPVRTAPAPAHAMSPIGDEQPHFSPDTEGQKPRRVRPPLKHPGLLVVGIVATSVGGALSLYALLGASCELGNCHDTATREALLLGSFAAIGIGIPLIVIGGKRERAASIALAPWILPGRGGLQLRLQL